MALGNDGWLLRIASAPDLHARAREYDEWAATYDADMRAIGYMNTAVAGALVGRHVPVRGARILDAGCGTGALGELLAAVGFTDLAGIDMSDGMLDAARARNVYTQLDKRVLGERLGFDDGSFTAAVAMGVFASGNAPAHALDEVLRVTRSGGYVIFNVAKPPWEEGGFKAKAHALESTGRWAQVEVAGPYRPMPQSAVRVDFTTRAYVYRVA